MSKKTYEIGGKKFWMDELVLSQEEALAEILGPVLGDGEVAVTARGLVEALLLKKGLRRALAVALIPEGMTVADRNVDDVAAHLGDALTLTQQAEIIRDFFGCNTKAASQFGKLNNVIPLKVAPPES